MRHSIIIILLAAAALNSAGVGRHSVAFAQERVQNLKVIQPPEGVYHGAFPEFGETEDVVKTEPIKKFEDSVGKKIAWAYFSNNWFVENDEGETWTEIKFPKVVGYYPGDDYIDWLGVSVYGPQEPSAPTKHLKSLSIQIKVTKN